MKSRPMLFSAPMVRALLAGTKSETRRVVKFAGAECIEEHDNGRPWLWSPQHEGWTVCSRCGLVRNYDRESPCRRVMPEIEPRDGGAS